MFLDPKMTPRDPTNPKQPSKNGITALAMCDSDPQLLAAHVVDVKGASAEHAIGQVPRDLRIIGQY